FQATCPELPFPIDQPRTPCVLGDPSPGTPRVDAAVLYCADLGATAKPHPPEAIDAEAAEMLQTRVGIQLLGSEGRRAVPDALLGREMQLEKLILIDHQHAVSRQCRDPQSRINDQVAALRPDGAEVTADAQVGSLEVPTHNRPDGSST